ncbi:hypothetical protein scyTo_0004585 [Scyliorhinus torazame]|uniref:Uncharacterized protein n=1 Tax=Scyliorhinus torazame TaxID=75743 RepID=A0A401NTW2_SCYTO|nr:hypothetical protein [Scyliorhinus torazame]
MRRGKPGKSRERHLIELDVTRPLDRALQLCFLVSEESDPKHAKDNFFLTKPMFCCRLKSTQRYALQLLRTFTHSASVELSPVTCADDSAKPKRPKSRRLRSLDTFRG